MGLYDYNDDKNNSLAKNIKILTNTLKPSKKVLNYTFIIAVIMAFAFLSQKFYNDILKNSEIDLHSAKNKTKNPFETSLLSPLKEKYCFEYLKSNEPSNTRETFNKLVWSKIDESLKEIINTRVDVCSPFEIINSNLIAATLCRAHDCANNNVHFYIETSGLIAIDYFIDGICDFRIESGFSYEDQLCKRNY